LRPEKIQTRELLLEHTLDQSWRIVGSVYSNRLTDLISFDGTTWQNNAPQQAEGMLAALEGRWADGWRLRGSMAWQHVKNTSTGAHLENSPTQISKIALVAPLGQGIKLALDNQYISSRQSLGSNPVPLGGYMLTHLNLLYALPGLNLSFGVNNLFDKRYSQPSTYPDSGAILPGEGRTFRVQGEYVF
jgi:iron complex outermembrane receptor protein